MKKNKAETLSVLQMLRKVRNRIAKGWTKGVEARDKHGHETFASDAKAVKWCLMGAANRENIEFQALRRAFQEDCLVNLNDDLLGTKKRVLAYLDRKIDEAASKEREKGKR